MNMAKLGQLGSSMQREYDMYCPRCNKVFKHGLKKCPVCGAILRELELIKKEKNINEIMTMDLGN